VTTRVSMGEPEERPERENEEVLDYEDELNAEHGELAESYEPEVEPEPELPKADDDEQWPEGPTVGEVKRWKDIYTKIYVTTFPGDVKVAWRALRRDEYKQVMREMEALAQRPDVAPSEASFINEERIAEMAILFPEYVAGKNEENQLAGIVSLISQQVMEASGFVSTDIEEL
jgi:hypothetical protein